MFWIKTSGGSAILHVSPERRRGVSTPASRIPVAVLAIGLALAASGAAVIVRAVVTTNKIAEEAGRAAYLVRVIELSVLFSASLVLAGVAWWLVARLAESRRQLEQLAIRDSLTGLYNRRYFRETYAREVDRAQRTGTPFSIAMLDVDEFKQINDTLGHLAGDALLTSFADLLRSSLRSLDMIARYGGDEFVILMPSTTAVNARGALARFQRHLGEWRHEYAGRGLRVSIGVSTWDGATEVLEVADREMYMDKQRREITGSQAAG